MNPPTIDRIEIHGGFWGPRLRTNREVTLPAELENLRQTGHIDALRLDWKPGDPNPPHIFWESDLAKWMEAVAYILQQGPDPELERALDQIIDLLAAAQQPDGYLNAHFTVVEPQKRWSNLRDWHELYCTGHLIEAAIAHHEATGKRTFLDVMIRYADYIDSQFGTEEGKIRGYPGHQEIELALVRLYRLTAEKRYLDLSRFFIDERGRQPHYFDIEARARGEDPGDFGRGGYAYNQSHLPVREQHDAVGHSVRALYMYSAMADLALETGDESLLAACDRLFESVSQRRIYVTGGLGSSRINEGWTSDYDLPNEDAYAETCAAIGLIFWMERMLRLRLDRHYSDLMERALYNGFLSGISLTGDTFFYVNPLAVRRQGREEINERHTGERQGWFGCACCPPNVARLLASLGRYVYSEDEKSLAIHLYVQSRARLRVGDQEVDLSVQTDYPWDGEIVIEVNPEAQAEFEIRLRIPGWCEEWSLEVNGEAVDASLEAGYLVLDREWKPGDRITLSLSMAVRRLYADPRVEAARGRVALARGPLIYCIESVDNETPVERIALPRTSELSAHQRTDLLGEIVTIDAEACRLVPSAVGDLYTDAPPVREKTQLTAIPYYAWANREVGDMSVWIWEC